MALIRCTEDNEPAAGIFRVLDRSCTVPHVPSPIRQLLLGLLLACPLAAGSLAFAREEGGREPREASEHGERPEAREREDREDRSDRGERMDRERADRERTDSSGRDADKEDRSGRSEDSGRSGNSGRGKDADEDRRDSNRGSDRRTIDVERNERGGDRERAEVLLIGPAGVTDAVRGAGYEVLSERRLESLKQDLVRVRVRESESIEQAVDRLQRQIPEVRTAPNHVFRPMGTAIVRDAATPMTAAAFQAARNAGRIGVIDTGADATLPPLQGIIQATRGFAPGGYIPRPHGSAVAQLAAALGARIVLGDVFGVDTQQRLVAPAESIAAAIDWLLVEDVRVINISIEGPRNDVLGFVIDAALARGVVIVAAMGNGGPSAAPGYPAAYPGVVAVTALDENGLIYRRAARGKHVQFAARGSFPGTSPPLICAERVSGTSFAAPLVAAEVERRWRLQPQAAREQVLAAMRSDATDLGAPGWDPIYGWGRIDLQGNAGTQRPARLPD
jgi:subtilisin family serine protease